MPKGANLYAGWNCKCFGCAGHRKWFYFENGGDFFYLSNEGISLLENAGHLGLPIPEKLKKVLEQLHDRGEEDKDGE